MVIAEIKILGLSGGTLLQNNRQIQEDSIIIIEYPNGVKVRVDLKKQKLHTKPRSLIGLQKGSSFFLGTKMAKIISVE